MKVYLSVGMEGIARGEPPGPDRTEARPTWGERVVVKTATGERSVRFSSDDPITAFRGLLAGNRLAGAID